LNVEKNSKFEFLGNLIFFHFLVFNMFQIIKQVKKKKNRNRKKEYRKKKKEKEYRRKKEKVLKWLNSAVENRHNQTFRGAVKHAVGGNNHLQCLDVCHREKRVQNRLLGGFGAQRPYHTHSGASSRRVPSWWVSLARLGVSTLW
jgi:hypothetical protein